MTRRQWASLWHRLRFLLRRGSELRALDEELRFHVEMRAADLRRAGYSEETAQRKAARSVGDVAKWREETSAVLSWAWVEALVLDARFAMRALRRGGVASATSVLTLALGMGAVLAVFTLGRVLVLRPVTDPDADHLAVIYRAMTPGLFSASDTIPITLGNLDEVRSLVPAFANAGLGTWDELNMESGSSFERIRIGLTSGLFSVLGTAAAIGRTASAGEDSGGARVATLSHAFWKAHFQGDPGVLGKDVVLAGVSFRVIGVMPPGFRGLSDGSKLWIPARSISSFSAGSTLRFQRPEMVWGTIIVRLPENVSLEQARQQFANALPELASGDRMFAAQSDRVVTAGVMPMAEAQQHAVVQSIVLLLAIAVGAVMLIVFANVGGLMLVRIRARRGELAVRASLGAGRGQLLRQLIVEGNMLALAGGGLGLFLGYAGAVFLTRLRPALPNTATSFVLLRGADLLEGASLAPDATVVGVALLLILLVGTSIGIVTAATVTRDSMQALSAGGRTYTGRHGGRAVLVMSQLALAACLLSAAGLTLRSFNRLMHADLGFDADPVLVAKLARTGPGVESEARGQELISRLAELPGVSAVALSGTTPFEPEGISFGAITQVDDRQLGENDLPPFEEHSVSREYIRVLGISLHRGRTFDSSDESQQEIQPVLINQTAARLLWPGQDPIGRRIVRNENVQRVIGVVGDSRYQRIRTDPAPALYTLGGNGQVTTLFIRAERNPATLVPAVRRIVSEVEPGTSMFATSTVRQRVRESAGDTRYVTLLLSAFGAVAALLAAIGVYGMLAYSVMERRREFGIRMAVGATPRELVAGVMRQGVKLLTAGLAIGLLMAAASAGVLRAFLFEIQPGDPATIASVVALLALVGGVATLLPALRAGRVDPVVVLRE